MIVSHKNRFIFLKTRKTAGSSIEIALSKHCGPEDIITQIAPSEEELRLGLGYRGRQNTQIPLNMYRKWDLWFRLRGGGPAHHFNHTPAKLLRKRLGANLFDEYYKFCVVRNPWDRAVSLFYFNKYGQGMPGLPDSLSFADFLNQTPVDQITDTSIFMLGNDPAVDRFIRFENLKDEWPAILEHLGLGMTELPRAKSDSRKNREHYSLMYDDKSISLVSELCKWEIERFAYKFDDHRV